jgi:hypothetical protein
MHSVVHRPLYCDIQPYCNHLPQQALKIVTTAQILIDKGATSLVIVVDKEDRAGCNSFHAANLSHSVAQQLAYKGQQHIGVHTVLKVTSFENWLLADTEALKSLDDMFIKVGNFEREVGRNRADQIDALAVLNRHTIDGKFHKKNGAVAICKRMDPIRAAKNSRSLRRFLRVAGVVTYCSQSKKPA